MRPGLYASPSISKRPLPRRAFAVFCARVTAAAQGPVMARRSGISRLRGLPTEESQAMLIESACRRRRAPVGACGQATNIFPRFSHDMQDHPFSRLARPSAGRQESAVRAVGHAPLAGAARLLPKQAREQVALDPAPGAAEKEELELMRPAVPAVSRAAVGV